MPARQRTASALRAIVADGSNVARTPAALAQRRFVIYCIADLQSAARGRFPDSLAHSTFCRMQFCETVKCNSAPLCVQLDRIAQQWMTVGSVSLFLACVVSC
jgi:hypothetical protein